MDHHGLFLPGSMQSLVGLLVELQAPVQPEPHGQMAPLLKVEPVARAGRVAEQKAYLATVKDVALGSDAFFPFSDNIERAVRSGVKYIAEPGGSIRDDAVIDCCNKYGAVMAFTGMRLFHH